MRKNRPGKNTHIILLSNGGVIDLVVPDPDSHDEFYKELYEHNGYGFYYIGNWCHVSATYKGTPLDYINMSLVVGIN